MARQNHGPLSRAKGKIGGVVYQQYEGMQISREYQPVVKNPQTDKQTINRAKFKLSSQIVAQFKEVISARLSKLAIYERMRRAAAVNAIYGAIDDGTPDTPQTLVTNVTYAINAKSLSGLTGPDLDFSTNTISISGNEDETVLFVMCVYDADKGDLTSRIVDSFEGGGASHTEGIVSGERAVVMAVAMKANTEVGRATISNVANTASGWQNEISRAVSAGDIEISSMTSLVATGA